MATYRPLRIAPDLPNQDERFDDTPPASPYQNRLPPRRGPTIKISSFSLPIPSIRTLGWLAFISLSLIVYFAPRQYKPKLLHPTHAPSLKYKNVDWRMFAYTSFATDQHHVCAALMIFSQLDEYGSKADRILFYPEEWTTHPEHMPENVHRMLGWAKDLFRVKLKPVKVHGMKQSSWPTEEYKGHHRFLLPDNQGELDPSATKFLALAQTQYLRVIHLDPHVTLQRHLDDLFIGPPARIGLTRRYLTSQNTKRLSAHVIIADPRKEDAESLFALSQQMTYQNDYFDSQILTEQFGDSAMVLSHRIYGLNSVEFRREDHFDFFGNDWEEWVPERVKREAAVIVFDEAPIPKPWVSWPEGMPNSLLPQCDLGSDSDKDIGCRNRKAWLRLYTDYRKRRKDICRMMTIAGGKWEHTGVDGDYHP